jgi:hypothetical protein
MPPGHAGNVRCFYLSSFLRLCACQPKRSLGSEPEVNSIPFLGRWAFMNFRHNDGGTGERLM